MESSAACTVAIASTGSIVVAGGRDGRRAITLVPDYQLCIVKQEQLVEFMAEALEVFERPESAPLTFFSGPSATVDIEMTRGTGRAWAENSGCGDCDVRQISCE